MTWTNQTPISSSWSRQSEKLIDWSNDIKKETGWNQQSNMVITHPGLGTFNVTGQTFNQSGILFNHKIFMGSQDVLFNTQKANQTAWREQ